MENQSPNGPTINNAIMDSAFKHLFFPDYCVSHEMFSNVRSNLYIINNLLENQELKDLVCSIFDFFNQLDENEVRELRKSYKAPED